MDTPAVVEFRHSASYAVCSILPTCSLAYDLADPSALYLAVAGILNGSRSANQLASKGRFAHSRALALTPTGTRRNAVPRAGGALMREFYTRSIGEVTAY